MFTTLTLLALSVAFLVNSWLLKNNREITDIHTEMLKHLEKLIKIQWKINEFQDKEILWLSEKIENLEKILEKNAWTDEIFISRDEFLESLKMISEDFENSEKWEKKFWKKSCKWNWRNSKNLWTHHKIADKKIEKIGNHCGNSHIGKWWNFCGKNGKYF